MKIRIERHNDAAAIRLVTEEAFKPRHYDAETPARIAEALGETFAPSTSRAENSSTSPNEHRIIVALREAGALTLSLVAEEENQVIGHVASSPVKIENLAGLWLGLGLVSVTPGKQGKGIGSALIREGLAQIEKLDAEGCVLLGFPPFYGRFGFTHDPELTYYGQPNSFLQRLVIKGRVPKGDVSFHPAFDLE